jgi:tRNA(Ile)-lysidine synthase
MGPDPAVAQVRLAVRKALAGLDVPARGTGPPLVLAACSGGPDSLALAAALAHEARRAGLAAGGVTVDHQLQHGSAAQAARVTQALAGLGLDPVRTETVRADGPGGPEAAARAARYAALDRAAGQLGAVAVLLGHTLDDQAETVLLGLARGSGGRSLSGMRRSFDVYRRPLLGITRAQTEAACHAEGIDFWRDPHNEDPRFTRSRVRHRVLPMLEQELGPGVAGALARTADLLREDVQVLDALADRVYDDLAHDGALECPRLEVEPPGVLHRVLRLAALGAGCPPSELFRVHVLSIAELVHEPADRRRGDKQIRLPGHVTAYRDGDWLRFRRTPVAG